VATDGADTADGSAGRPFRTISRAAELALPGDTVMVHAGEYREWVRPRRAERDPARDLPGRCKTGYTATIRPPASITGREKKASEDAYGFHGKAATTEYDHLISLELGGDPDSPLNLWPEPNKSSASGTTNPKDKVENTLRTLVCDALHGKAYLPLVKAQYLVATNWTTAIATAQKELVG